MLIPSIILEIFVQNFYKTSVKLKYILILRLECKNGVCERIDTPKGGRNISIKPTNCPGIRRVWVFIFTLHLVINITV